MFQFLSLEIETRTMQKVHAVGLIGNVKKLTLYECPSDPYVKVYLICDGRRLKKRKTTTKKSTLNPVYNEAIIFDIPPENVEQVSLSIIVMDYDR